MNMPGSSNLRASAVIERTYRARVEQLWALWTTKEGFESWWGAAGSHVEVQTLEAREGGALHYGMIALAAADIDKRRQLALPRSSSVRARFAEFRPYRRLVLTHIVDFVPGVKPYESTIAVDFFPSGDAVRMVTTIEPMHDEAFTQTSVTVFSRQLDLLDARFERC